MPRFSANYRGSSLKIEFWKPFSWVIFVIGTFILVVCLYEWREFGVEFFIQFFILLEWRLEQAVKPYTLTCRWENVKTNADISDF